MADFTIGLTQSLKQEQTLSPQMLQSLALLPLPILELKAHIQKEIETNPALEIPDKEFSSSNNTNIEKTSSHDGTNEFSRNYDDRLDDADSSYYENLSNDLGNEFSGKNFDDGFDSNYDNYGNYDKTYTALDASDTDRFNMMLENTSSQGKTLQEHLLEQLGEVSVSCEVEKAAKMLISNLDANGFFLLQPNELFEDSSFDEKTIQEAINIVQNFDPDGICVKDFRQSLILQAKLSGMAQSDLEIFAKLVTNELEKIKTGKTKEVAFDLGISEQDLETFISILKRFTPYPGRNYGTDGENYIEPDFAIHSKDGVLTLDINRAGIPKLEVSPQFCALSKDLVGPNSKEATKYINGCVKQANQLIDQVNLRFKTLYNAAVAIMDIQKEFFLYGPKFLKTMTLKDVAERIGVHETTMSRLAQSKWVDTDWGLFQLKYLFTQGVRSNTSSDETVSRNVVKEMIKEIIEERGALSDQKISNILLEKGIKCARRTVSKYRTELNIDSSYERS